MTEQDRTPCIKLPFNAAKFSGPFFTPQNIRKAKSLWNKCSNRSPQWMQFTSDLQHLVWEGYVGVKRFRKALCVLWGTLQGTMEKFLNIRKCFLKIKICIGMWARFQSTLLPETFQIRLLAASASFVKGQFQYCGTQCPSSLTNLVCWSWDCFSKGFLPPNIF